MPSAVFFASVSLIDPVALSPLLHRVFADGFRRWCAFRLCGGASPHALGSVGALGELRWLHLYRLKPDLVGLRRFAVWLWSSGRCFLSVRHHVRLHDDHFVRFPDSCVSLPRIYHRVQFLGRLTRRVAGLTFCPSPRSSRILSFAWTYSPDSDPDAFCDRHSVAVSLSPSLTVALTPCNCGTLGGLSSWLAPYLIPPRVVSLSLPALGACCA